MFLDNSTVSEHIYRHTIHQIEAEYHSYLMISVMLRDSWGLKSKIVNEKKKKKDFSNLYLSDTDLTLKRGASGYTFL